MEETRKEYVAPSLEAQQIHIQVIFATYDNRPDVRQQSKDNLKFLGKGLVTKALKEYGCSSAEINNVLSKTEI